MDGSERDIIAALGSAAATYLDTTLTGGERIGISSWSQTLLAVVDRMRPLRVPGADSVIQLMGGFGNSSVQTQGNRLLTEFARIIGATATFVPAPALVGNKAMRESLLDDPAMESDTPRNGRDSLWRLPALAAFHRRRSCVPAATRQISLTRTDFMRRARSAMSRLRFFDSAGNLVPSALDDRVVGRCPSTLREIRGASASPAARATRRYSRGSHRRMGQRADHRHRSNRGAAAAGKFGK